MFPDGYDFEAVLPTPQAEGDTTPPPVDTDGSPIHTPNRQVLQAILVASAQNLAAFNQVVQLATGTLVQRTAADTAFKGKTDTAINNWLTMYFSGALQQANVQTEYDAIGVLLAAHTTFTAARTTYLAAETTYNNAILAANELTYYNTAGWKADRSAFITARSTFNAAQTTWETAQHTCWTAVRGTLNPLSTSSHYGFYTYLRTLATSMFASGNFLDGVEKHADAMTAWANAMTTVLAQLGSCLQQSQTLAVLATLA